MTRISVSAPGKLHLLGEHVVVHNRPAIIVAVDKRCLVEITPRKDQNIKIISKNYKKKLTTNFTKVVSKFQKAEKDFNLYNENNDIALLKSITQDPLDYPLLIIGQFISSCKLQSLPGLDLIIDSQIPIGAGMGSSGALAVAITGALFMFTNKKLDRKTINQIAFLCEQKKHGKPSGGDNTASCFGKLIWFKKDEGLKPLKFTLPQNITKNFYIANTGTPAETTGEMVSRVKDLLKERPESTESIFDDQADLVKNLLTALKIGNSGDVLKIIKKGEGNLEKLGVVSSYVKKIIREIEDSGGAAKICGGGGIKKGTGMLLIYHDNLKKLKKVLKSHQLSPTQLTLGAEGVREELW